jgi:4-amino-4-deoxy-L-arabinose transferase-like glycosyltransferase
MYHVASKSANPIDRSAAVTVCERCLPLVLCAICLIILFFNLGAAALFEPDEGRNAEKAREILLLNDWVTPHQNFLPVLDKPIFFYWLVALSFKLFGLSDWSARLPSALAAVGCLVLVYRFARDQWGFWEAVWSPLILATSVEFFALSRLVIFDMTLTFFNTLSLVNFYAAAKAENRASRRLNLFLMYAAMGAGTLTKGPISVVIPGMVIFFYFLMARKWSFLKEMDLLLGAFIYFAIVTPWYAWVEIRNPGYLRYFLWEENFIRYLTPHFGRTEPWYYFFLVLGAGFLPWTFLLPFTARKSWKESTDTAILFLLLWVLLPFVFFSLSKSKLPHYILPIYPPLALLAAKTMVGIVRESSRNQKWRLYLPWVAAVVPVVYLAAGKAWPSILPHVVHQAINGLGASFWIFCVSLIVAAIIFAVVTSGEPAKQDRAYLLYGVGTAIFILFVGHVLVEVSPNRSAKELADKARPFAAQQDRFVIYDTDLEGLPYYLRVDKPIWLVWSGSKDSVMGSIYIAEKRPQASSEYGQVLFTFDEFRRQWKDGKQKLLVFVKAKNLGRIDPGQTDDPKILLRVNEFVLATKS